MLTLLEGFPDDVLAVEAIGMVSAQDYRTVLAPAVREKAAGRANLRLYFQLGAKFEGMTPAAMWEDAKLGVEHWSGWGRLAVVTDVAWITDAVRMFAPLFHQPVRAFSNAQANAARAWVVEET